MKIAPKLPDAQLDILVAHPLGDSLKPAAVGEVQHRHIPLHQLDQSGSDDLCAAVEADLGDLSDSGLADLAHLIGPDLQPLAPLANRLPLADDIKGNLIVQAGEEHSDPLLGFACLVFFPISFLFWLFLRMIEHERAGSHSG